MAKTRVFIAIDGSNLYYKLADKQIGLKNLVKFDYHRFCVWLAKDSRVTDCIYYVGQVREKADSKKSSDLKRNQDRLIAYLKNQKISVKTGYILKTGEKYYEKGVDVQIAVDICMKAVRNEYDRLILISSDTDLIPAIKEVRSLGKEVEYVGFDFNPSFALIRFSDSRTLLKKEDFLPFSKQK